MIKFGTWNRLVFASRYCLATIARAHKVLRYLQWVEVFIYIDQLVQVQEDTEFV